MIRNLLDTFGHSAYVGYTATPFANIFIDPATPDDMVSEDLFPRSFIVSLDAPSNYFGATRVFLEDSSSFLRWIEDAEDLLPSKHKKDHPVNQLPESLVDAVRAFVVTRAIRIIRGDGAEHSSMLVNASRFVSVQGAIGRQVTQHLQAVQDAALLNHALAEAQADLEPEEESTYESQRTRAPAQTTLDALTCSLHSLELVRKVPTALSTAWS